MVELVKISELTAASALDGSEQLPVVQGGNTRRTTTEDVADLAAAIVENPYAIDASNFWSLVHTLGGTSWLVVADDPSYAPVDQSGNGTSNHPVNTSASNDLDALAYRYSTASAATNNAGGFRAGSSAALHYIKAAAGASGSGGFVQKVVFGLRAQNSAARAFFGVCTQSANPISASADPSAAANTFGFGKDAADANLQFMHNDGSGVATKTDTGVTLLSLLNRVLSLEIAVPPGGASASARIVDVGTGEVICSGTASTNLPAAGVALDWCTCLNSAGTSTAVSLGVNRAVLGYPVPA